ncbi:LCP family protein [Sphaerisporangium sp. B11E5]|uniref:LCP family protein n=1 Tax=Sphaerisporangium sp. B11E5 TaxID=3153563 RepID=UPI00325E98EC
MAPPPRPPDGGERPRRHRAAPMPPAAPETRHPEGDPPPRRRRAAEPPEPPDGPGSRRGRDSGGGKRSRVLAWISIALTVVLVGLSLGGYTLYRSLLGNLRTQDVSGGLNANRPVNTTGALNVLLVGSDTRAGNNKRYGQHMENEGERTDTIILLHVSPNRDKATLISFPRDSMVQIPACKHARTKAAIPPRLDMINSAFNEGGMACTINTIEANTNIRIDHYIKVDFTGFKNIVDALGGIQICVPHAVSDKKAKLELRAGKQIVRGEAALAYVRARYALGDGGDISRIKRQQIFLSQVVKKATSGDTLTNPGKLISLITAAAQSVVMDPQLDVDTLVQIAQSARSLTASGVKFVTVPWEAYPSDKNRVQWKQPDAGRLFESLRNDIEVTPTAKPSAAASASGPAKPSIKPAQVKVQVLNGTSTPGRAKDVAEALAAQGFDVVTVGDARNADGTDRPQTQVLYPKKAADGADYAAPLAAKLVSKVTPADGKVKPGSVVPFTPSATAVPTAQANADGATAADGPVIQLVIGADFKGVKVPVTIPDSARVVDSKTDVCST